MVKVQRTSNNQLILTIPKKIAEFKGIDRGTEIIFREHTKNSLILEVAKKKNKEG
jgi:hypothetical protein